jgi:hypothetical protein
MECVSLERIPLGTYAKLRPGDLEEHANKNSDRRLSLERASNRRHDNPVGGMYQAKEMFGSPERRYAFRCQICGAPVVEVLTDTTANWAYLERSSGNPEKTR